MHTSMQSSFVFYSTVPPPLIPPKTSLRREWAVQWEGCAVKLPTGDRNFFSSQNFIPYPSQNLYFFLQCACGVNARLCCNTAHSTSGCRLQQAVQCRCSAARKAARHAPIHSIAKADHPVPWSSASAPATAGRATLPPTDASHHRKVSALPSRDRSRPQISSL